MLNKIKDKLENIFKIGKYTNVSGTNGQLQKIQVQTLRNIEDAMKVGQFGFNSKAPIGSRSIVARIGNENIVIANEHQASILDISTGNTIVYNQSGDFIKVENGIITISAPSVQVTANDVEITSSTLTHNGTNVGDTHTHAQGADSAGNTQVATNPPS